MPDPFAADLKLGEDFAHHAHIIAATFGERIFQFAHLLRFFTGLTTQ